MPRLSALTDWLARQLPDTNFTLAPASADASFRRYFRATLADGTTRIVMDAPPEHEDCKPFIHVAGLLQGAGLHAPEILAQDLKQGFLLLSDLGGQTYLQKMKGGRNDDTLELSAIEIDRMMRDAIGALVKWQLASRDNELPPYDATLLRRELDLFPEWFVIRHLNVTLDDKQRLALEQVFALLIVSALEQPKVFVHRDFMPRNLMVSDPNPGILDFQDAVHGPISYDIASLMRDAFISWDEERVIDWTVRYWEAARKAGLPVPADFSEFYRQVEWMGLQRHLKVLGIFCRLNYRDGKGAYLADLPRFLKYARDVSQRYVQLKPLARLLDVLDPQPVTVGYTF
jgi:aminoglycoside/choline kinase family phosphotransferase